MCTQVLNQITNTIVHTLKHTSYRNLIVLMMSTSFMWYSCLIKGGPGTPKCWLCATYGIAKDEYILIAFKTKFWT